MKPGNSVEEKTLRIGMGARRKPHPGPGMPRASSAWGKPRTRGDNDRVKESIQSGDGRARNRRRDTRVPKGTPVGNSRRVMRGPVQAERPDTARPFLA